ncbi:hypothetical protein L3Q82_000356 [Scortum barcoo]|uniref:Uncharacterized protein n=1 Tax=Scortum barcoo TaxID=214431 RepID=A0ACB8X9U6_9TELE|nr:hypothetical protein L3Q82_000356 [Scortum barcoo]
MVSLLTFISLSGLCWEKTCWRFLTTAWREDGLPLSCRRAVITLLPKKGDLQELKNWRPVSLLCTDYKIMSKVLASRLREVMASIIHPDQTYCVPGRLISDNVTLIRDILEVSGSLAVDTGLISIDQEKAFDRVEHKYLWQTLATFGFSPGFIAKIRVLYCDIASVLKINGGLSAPFRVQRGIRQGCCLSGMLYSLAIEPLLHKLRNKLSGVLACVDPPVSLLSRIQAVLVDFFWDRLHWVPQSILFLPKEEGGQGLVHLASRGAAFSLQFLQRLLTGPADLVWRRLSCCILQRCGGLRQGPALFLMDCRSLDTSSLPAFYRSVFSVWILLRKQRREQANSLYWLLQEPVVELAGPRLDDPVGLAAQLGLRSTRIMGQFFALGLRAGLIFTIRKIGKKINFAPFGSFDTFLRCLSSSLSVTYGHIIPSSSTQFATMFYQSVVASVLFYTVVCWGGSISKKDTSRLDKLIRRAGSVVGTKLDSLVTVAEARTLDKLLDIMDNASHPLHTVISNQRSLFSERLLLPKCRTNRLKNSFVHQAITLYNSYIYLY